MPQSSGVVGRRLLHELADESQLLDVRNLRSGPVAVLHPANVNDGPAALSDFQRPGLGCRFRPEALLGDRRLAGI